MVTQTRVSETTTTIHREIFYDGKSKKQITREGDEGARGKCIEAVSIFKTGIKPQWEEPVNKTGGGWYINPITKIDMLEKSFETILLSMIGETLDDGADVNGLRVVDKSARRKGCIYRLEVWAKSIAVKGTLQERLEKSLNADTEVLNRSSGVKMYWKKHSY